MHIHPSSPSSDYGQPIQREENAAIKIQAGFRGYRVRKQMQNQSRTDAPNFCTQQSRISEPFHINIGKRLTSPNINVGSNSKGSSSQVESSTKEDQSATKIQAGVRGFLVRKKQKIAVDAATKIQASFRGFKARKEAQNMKEKEK